MILPGIYARADLSLRIGLGVPAPNQRLNFHTLPWAHDVQRAWDRRVQLIKRELRSKPEWPHNMIIFSLLNPVFRKGKLFNTRSWEGLGPLHLDRLFRRPETRRSHQDIYIGEHDHREMPKKRADLFNKLFFNVKEIQIVEDLETAGGQSLRQVQRGKNIYHPDLRTYPLYKTPATDIQTQSDLDAYRSLFRAQVSLMNKSPGQGFYQPIRKAIPASTPQELAKMDSFHRSNKNFFNDADDVRTGWLDKTWQIAEAYKSRYQQIAFYIYDIRNKRYVLLPTSIRSHAQNMTTSWAEDETMGRPDDILTYVKTVKEHTIDMVFTAQNPIDYIVMWRKLKLLESFQYPQYSQEGIRINPPVVRLRLGDMIRRGRGGHEGVAGVFRNFSIVTDETTTVWQTEENELAMKHGKELVGTGPRLVEVSFNFKVLHDSEYIEHEDGTVDFIHDAVYRDDGYFATKLGSTFGEPQRAFDQNRIVIKKLDNPDTAGEEADGSDVDLNAIGDSNPADLGNDMS